jgi:hypothetical protein
MINKWCSRGFLHKAVVLSWVFMGVKGALGLTILLCIASTQQQVIRPRSSPDARISEPYTGSLMTEDLQVTGL